MTGRGPTAMRDLLLVLCLLSGCAMPGARPDARVHHMVLCWLKEPGNADHRQRIIDASASFRAIPGVLNVHAGQAMASDRAIVDDSFDVAISLSFADEQSLKTYLAHPTHEKAKLEILIPIVSRIVVYDFCE